MRNGKPLFNLQTTIAVFACIVVAVALLVTDIFISNRVMDNTYESLSTEAVKIARIAANSAEVKEALTGKPDQQAIQEYAEQLRAISDVRFIVVIDMQRIRHSHPTTTKIGEYYAEHDAEQAFNGKETTSIENGSLGRSLRAFAPVFAPDGQQLGVVLVGIMLDSVAAAVEESRGSIFVGVIGGLAVGVIGALILARNIKKILFGLEPFAIAQMFEERSAMLQSVREGILAVDKESRLTIVNDEALRLFHQAGIEGPAIGKRVDEHVPNTRLQNVLKTGVPELEQEQDLNGTILLTNRVPVTVDGEIVGAIATFRDKTEMRQLAEKLTGVHNYAEALRSQTHEFMNKLHVILGMIRMQCYDQLTSYVNQIAQQYQAEVGTVVRKIKDPVLAGFLLGKMSRARELGTDFQLSGESMLPEPAEPLLVHDLITIMGNLIDNALDAVGNAAVKEIYLHIAVSSGWLVLEVSDSGVGLSAEQEQLIFTKGFSSKGVNRGLGLYLTKRCLERLQGTIDIQSGPTPGATFIVTLPYQCKERYFD